MSSTSSTAPSQTSSNLDQPPASSGSSSTLYLYTFLVTLILLSTISIIIVTRSYIYRRRFRRQVEEALRNGQVLSPGLNPGLVGLSSRITDKLLGPTPKLWDVWVQSIPPTTMTNKISNEDGDASPSGTTDKFPWAELRPLSAEIIPVQSPGRKHLNMTSMRPNFVSSRMPPSLNTDFRANSDESTSTRLSIAKLWSRKRASSSTSVSLRDNAPPEAWITTEKDPCIRVVTLIKMPSPHESTSLLQPGGLSRAETGSHQSFSSLSKGKNREDRMDLSPVVVGVTELKVLLDEREETSNLNNNSKS